MIVPMILMQANNPENVAQNSEELKREVWSCPLNPDKIMWNCPFNHDIDFGNLKKIDFPLIYDATHGKFYIDSKDHLIEVEIKHCIFCCESHEKE